MGVDPEETEGIQFFAGRGCETCRYTGFRGRTAIFEYLPVDGDIRKEITNRATTEALKDLALQKGMVTLRQDGWNKVKRGITTISEVLRVTLAK